MWLAEFYAGKHRPAWAAEAKRPLLKMLRSDDPREKMTAAMVLIPLGQLDQTLPVVGELPQAHPELYGSAAGMLPWLVWEKRLELFSKLFEMADGPEQYTPLIVGLTGMGGRRTTNLIWNLLGKEKLPKDLIARLQHGLSKAYLGDRYYAPTRASLSAKRAVKRDARYWAAAGNEVQRIMALGLLAGVAPDQAVKIARRTVDDKSLAADHRRDAFRILLWASHNQSKAAAVKNAVDALADDEVLRRIALAYLVDDLDSLRMSSAGYPLSYSMHIYHGFTSGKPIIPKAPGGLKREHVRPLLEDKDPKTAAYAGYLLALMGQPEGLPPLMDYWRSLGRRDWDDNRLVVRAVAVLNDSTKVAELRKIYGETDSWRKRELYWTIRIMTGPEIYALRKQMRDEVGMRNLQ